MSSGNVEEETTSYNTDLLNLPKLTQLGKCAS